MLKRMPFVLLLVTAVLLFIAGLFTGNKTSVDIHLQDRILVIAQGHIWGIAAFFLFLLWLVNIATHRVLFSNKLTWLHILATLAILLLLLRYAYTHPNSLWSDAHTTVPEEKPVFAIQRASGIVVYCITALIAVQLIFVANLFIGVYKKTEEESGLS